MLNWRAHLKREIARCNSSFASFAYEERCGCGAQFSATVKRLKYRKPGGGKGIRTPGLLIANETLYQLSYTPIGCRDGGNKSDKNPFVHLLYTCVETANVIFGHIDAAQDSTEKPEGDVPASAAGRHSKQPTA